MADNNLYYDPNTDAWFLGKEKLVEEIQEKINKELHDKDVLSYHEVCEMLADSIEDNELRAKFLEGLLTPWSEGTGYIWSVTIDLSESSPVIKWDML